MLTQDITIALDEFGEASITPLQGYALNKSSFNCSEIGANTVTLTVTDINGNVNSAIAIVTIEDKIKPVALGKNITVQLDATGNVSVLPASLDNGSTDACGIRSFKLSKTDFTCEDVGRNILTLTVTDNNDNTSTTDVEITVEDKIRPSAPAFTWAKLTTRSGLRYIKLIVR